jgi:hypothetical protein
MPSLNFVHLTCECTAPQHTLRFHYDEIHNELNAQIFMESPPIFWKRLIIAVKYLFGYKCQFGHFDTFTLQNGDKEKLIALATLINEDE